MSETFGRWFDLAATTLVSMNTVVVLSEVYFELNIKWTECVHIEPRTTERELSERTVVLKIFFQIQRGEPLDLQKWFLQCGGVICNHMQNLICRTSPNGPRNTEANV